LDESLSVTLGICVAVSIEIGVKDSVNGISGNGTITAVVEGTGEKVPHYIPLLQQSNL